MDYLILINKNLQISLILIPSKPIIVDQYYPQYSRFKIALNVTQKLLNETEVFISTGHSISSTNNLNNLKIILSLSISQNSKNHILNNCTVEEKKGVRGLVNRPVYCSIKI